MSASNELFQREMLFRDTVDKMGQLRKAQQSKLQKTTEVLTQVISTQITHLKKMDQQAVFHTLGDVVELETRFQSLTGEVK